MILYSFVHSLLLSKLLISVQLHWLPLIDFIIWSRHYLNTLINFFHNILNFYLNFILSIHSLYLSSLSNYTFLFLSILIWWRYTISSFHTQVLYFPRIVHTYPFIFPIPIRYLHALFISSSSSFLLNFLFYPVHFIFHYFILYFLLTLSNDSAFFFTSYMSLSTYIAKRRSFFISYNFPLILCTSPFLLAQHLSHQSLCHFSSVYLYFICLSHSMTKLFLFISYILFFLHPLCISVSYYHLLHIFSIDNLLCITIH